MDKLAVMLWCDDRRGDWAARLIELMGSSVHVVAVGGPDGQQADALAM